MNITKIVFFATLLTMLFVSCEKENMYEIESTTTSVAKENKGIGYASVYFEDPTAISTRASEHAIYNLSFFVFNSEGERDEEYGYQTFNYTGNQYTFAITPGENKTIIAAANLQHLGDLGNADLETVQNILQKAILQRPAEVPESGIAMIAENSGIHTTKGDVKVVKMTLSSF